MDSEDQNNIPGEVQKATQPPKTTVEGFLYSLGNVVSNLRREYKFSENGALKVVQAGLEYDLNRRHMSQEETVGKPNEQ